MNLPSFGPLESAAIGIGLRDPLPYFGGHGRLARLFRTLFGITPVKPLADARLDALRRLVMVLRRSRQNPGKAIALALSAGIKQDQIDYLIARFGVGTGANSRVLRSAFEAGMLPKR